MSRWSRRTLLASSASTVLVAGCPVTPAVPIPATGSTDTEPVDTGPPACALTGEDIEGPFWVQGVPVRHDLDVYGDDGPKLAFDGVVRDAATCEPLADAVVEVWHADPDGAYDDAADGKYRGQTRSAADGTYQFRTVIPGRYLNGSQYRPSHVHVKVWVDGVERLTTQLYFANDPYNDIDPWFDAERIVGDLDDGQLVLGKMDLTV